MRECAGLDSVDDGIRVGKPELRFALKDHGVHMGITADSMARQVRHRCHGAEALRFVREGNEVWVMVRLPEEERTTRATLDDALLKTPSGAFVPLSQVADITETQSFTVLARRDGHRIYPVTADVRMGINDDLVEEVLEDEIVPAVMAAYPGTVISEGGEEAEEDKALGTLGFTYLCALGVMFILPTVQFNSYRQPFLVLSVIPFSFLGAVWGHMLLGHELSIVSVIGIIAMSGVVVNNSLLLVDAYNRLRARGMPHRRAIVEGACRRFRPILLTSLTTCFGLVPLMLETSEQAQFLLPAAISLSFEWH